MQEANESKIFDKGGVFDLGNEGDKGLIKKGDITRFIKHLENGSHRILFDKRPIISVEIGVKTINAWGFIQRKLEESLLNFINSVGFLEHFGPIVPSKFVNAIRFLSKRGMTVEKFGISIALGKPLDSSSLLPIGFFFKEKSIQMGLEDFYSLDIVVILIISVLNMVKLLFKSTNSLFELKA
uniref:Uncharacterized protein n=1 Tax=Cannabis sativa TaxID=3483 RepID=A0A803PD59_CANSA